MHQATLAHLRNLQNLPLATLRAAELDLVRRKKPPKAGPEEWWIDLRLKALSIRIAELLHSQP